MKIFSKSKKEIGGCSQKNGVSPRSKIRKKNIQKNQNNSEDVNAKNDTILTFPFDQFGFEILWNATKNHFSIFLDREIYDFKIRTLQILNEQIADLFKTFYMDQKTKLANQQYENLKKANFIDY